MKPTSSRRPYQLLSQSELQDEVRSHRRDSALLRRVLKELDQRRKIRGNLALRKEIEELLAGQSESASGPRKKIASAPTNANTPRRVAVPRSGKAVTVSVDREVVEPLPLTQRTEDPVLGDEAEPRSQSFALIQPPGPGVGTPGWKPQAKRSLSLKLGAATPQIERFIVSLGALIDEMKSSRKGKKRIDLTAGVLVDLGGGEKAYSFHLDGDEQLFEDAEVELEARNRRAFGRIVSYSGSRLLISITQDFGNVIERATLFIDQTALLVLLRQRLIEAQDGDIALNQALAIAAVTGRFQSLPAPPRCDALIAQSFRRDQATAVTKALASPVFYLWGPPGTGKTYTLSAIVQSLFAADARVLICSNTNQAVDQVLLKLCRALGADHPALRDGHVLRLGKIVHQELDAEFGEHVSVDEVAKKRAKELTELRELKVEAQNQFAKEVRTCEEALLSYGELEKAEEQLRGLAKSLDRVTRERDAAIANDEHARVQLEARERAFIRATNATGLRKLFAGAVSKHEAAVETAKDRIPVVERARAEAIAAHGVSERLFLLSRGRRDKLTGAVGGRSIEETKRSIKGAEKKRAAAEADIAKIDAQIDKIKEELVPSARILGATLTKTYMKAKHLGRFDTVIVDEASMALMPSLYMAAGLATSRVVISGDFRQLSPIVTSEEEEIRHELGRNVFEASGTVALCETAGSSLPQLQMLTEQFRMADPICQLISPAMYSGQLVTASERESDALPLPAPFDQPLVIVDTSRLFPFESISASGSRSNLVHALVARNLGLLFEAAGATPKGAGLGVVTPYAAQASLHRDVLGAVGLSDAASGTVHRFQGDEKKVMVMEFPEGAGPARMVGMFLQGEAPSDESARLLNVAISRAQEHLIVVANLTHLDDGLPSGSFLRSALVEMQNQGTVVDARDVLSLKPMVDEATRFTRDQGAASTPESDIFNSDTFRGAFIHDLEAAKVSIVVYSAFYTEARVATYADIFRQKLSEGVAIRCVVRPPSRNGSMEEAASQRALDQLRSLGVVVDLRNAVHEKVAVIDQATVWAGSLNSLSYNGRTDEVMLRMTDQALARNLLASLSISGSKGAADDGLWATVPEAKECHACGGVRSFFPKGKFGPYFKCEACGKTISKDRA